MKIRRSIVAVTALALASLAPSWVNADYRGTFPANTVLGTLSTPGQSFTLISPQLTTLIAPFSGSTSGAVPASVAGATLVPGGWTVTPTLGVASTTAGTLGLYSATTNGLITLKNLGAPSSYSLNLPTTPGSPGQVMVSQGGGAAPMTWASSPASAVFVQHSNTASCTVGTNCNGAADDTTRYDNAGSSGLVIFTLPATPVAGNNWCFLVAAAQTLEILANTGETITMANTVGAAAGNLQTNTVGSSVCVYFQSATSAYVWTSMGTWSLT